MDSPQKEVLRHDNALRLFLLCLNCSLGTLFYGYQLGAYNDVIQEVHTVLAVTSNASTIDGLILSLLAVGGCIGSIASGYILKWLGRRACLIMTDFIGLVGTAVSLVPNLEVFIAGRFITGLNCGLNSSLVPLYIREFSPDTILGLTGSLVGLTIALGVVISFLVGLGSSDNPGPDAHYWQVQFAVPAIFCLIRLLNLFLVYKEESAFSYMAQGKEEKAQQVIQKVFRQDSRDSALRAIRRAAEIQKQSKMTIKDMFSAKYRKRMLVGLFIFFVMQFSGINAVAAYSSQIYQNGGYSTTVSKLLTLGQGTIQFVASMFAGVLIAKLNRKQNLMVGIIGSMITMALLSVTAYLHDQQNNHNSIIQTLIIIGIYVYSVVFGISLGTIPFVMVTDFLPGKGIAFSSTFMWLYVAVLLQIFPMINDLAGVYLNFAIFAGVQIIGAIVVVLYVPETKDKDPDYIENLFSPKHSIQADREQKMKTFFGAKDEKIIDSDKIKEGKEPLLQQQRRVQSQQVY